MQPYQPHRITRNRVLVGLMISTMLAACAAPAVDRTPGDTGATEPKPIPATTTAQAKADAAVNAAKARPDEIRFTDLESCKVETGRLQAEYRILQEAFEQGRLTGEAPIKPTLEPEECEAFLAAAEQEYAAQAPTYTDQDSCEASGAQCERVEPSSNNNYIQPVYRPSYFGGYFYNPWAAPLYIGGRRDYSQHTRVIYRDNQGSNSFGGYSGSSSPTRTKPSGTSSTGTSSTSTTPKTSNSNSTTTKPASTSGSNAITGRGSSGFGSSYKYTGKGGK